MLVITGERGFDHDTAGRHSERLAGDPGPGMDAALAAARAGQRDGVR